MAGWNRKLVELDSGATATGQGCRPGGPLVRRDRCGDAVAAGNVARRRRADARARFFGQEREGGRAGDQFTGRLAGAVATDLLAHPPAGPGKETAGSGV